MKISTTRFGVVEVEDGEAITFPLGLIGFAEETTFVMLRPRPSSAVAWLQSVKTDWLALPVVGLESLAIELDEEVLRKAVQGANIAADEPFAALAVVNAPAGEEATVNLLAPIVVNAETRRGAQVLVDTLGGSTRHPLVLRPRELRPTPVESHPQASAAP